MVVDTLSTPAILFKELDVGRQGTDILVVQDLISNATRPRRWLAAHLVISQARANMWSSLLESCTRLPVCSFFQAHNHSAWGSDAMTA